VVRQAHHERGQLTTNWGRLTENGGRRTTNGVIDADPW